MHAVCITDMISRDGHGEFEWADGRKYSGQYLEDKYDLLNKWTPYTRPSLAPLYYLFP